MKVIPVIDILNGLVVHAVKGKRREYQPLESTLTNSVEPLNVAKTFKKLGFSELYVADLDAIMKAKANFQMFKHIVDETGLNLMVDAGVSDLEMANQLLTAGISIVVIGTETLRTKSFVGHAVKVLGSKKVVVSMDFKGDEMLVRSEFVSCKDPVFLLREFREMGVLRVIILDLNRVGSNEGVRVDFLKMALKENMDVYVGGGVRDINDLIELKNLGVSGALVATALHSGKVSIEELKRAQLL